MRCELNVIIKYYSMVQSVKQGELKKQVEYYLSDKNLAQDSYFHSKITASKEVSHLSIFLRIHGFRKVIVK